MGIEEETPAATDEIPKKVSSKPNETCINVCNSN
jgi:hypothetical protein